MNQRGEPLNRNHVVTRSRRYLDRFVGEQLQRLQNEVEEQLKQQQQQQQRRQQQLRQQQRPKGAEIEETKCKKRRK